MHAYMIIAHNQFELLEMLIKKLDDKRNDIFVHIDAKVKDFDFDKFKSITKYSKIIFTEERISITWGDFSQVKTEMELLKTAVENEDENNPYTYYHLISGADLPIKTNDEIHAFFDKYRGKEFIHYADNNVSKSSVSRIRYYHLFRKHRNLFNKILGQAALQIQKFIGVNRLKNTGIRVQKGCNWFSITGSFAHYVVKNQQKYEKIFKYSYCCDEIFIQTIAENSGFKNNLFMSDCNDDHFACARLIDWKRGNPYVWKTEDYNFIISSPCMFARKFDIHVDKQIIEMLLEHIK